MRETQLHEQGDVIIKEGVMEDWMYRIISGTVGVYADYQSSPRLLTTLSRPDFFGEMGLIEKTIRSATVVALTEVKLERLDEEDYLTALQDDTKMVNNLLGSISSRIAILSKDYIEACEAISEFIRLEEQGLTKPKALMQKMQHILDESRRKA